MRALVCTVVGVGPGIGMAVARRFGREDLAIAAIARDRDRLARSAAELQEPGIVARAFGQIPVMRYR